MAYGSLEPNTAEPIMEALKKKTGLWVEYWRASAAKVRNRALGRISRRQVGLRRDGQQHYNKGPGERGRRAEVSRRPAQPKYKAKFVMTDPTQHTTTLQWIFSLDKIMGNEKADKFIRDLGATKPLMVECFAPSAERVSTGETPIAISLIRYTVTYAGSALHSLFVLNPRPSKNR